MIARLHGHVASIEDDGVVVDVGGVGYRVRVASRVVADLGPEGAPVTLHTRLIVRENEMSLYGATDPETMEMFDHLLTVGGVGPRLALAMLGTYDAAEIARAVVGEDVTSLSRVSGVGRKTAERIVLELKGKLAGLALGEVGQPVPASSGDDEAEAALLSLGYSRVEARRALAGTSDVAGEGLEARILAALRWLSG